MPTPLNFSGLLLILAMLASCAETQDQDSLLSYSKSAQKLFAEAMDEFDDEDCVSAEKLFQEVKRQFPYSSFAVLADVRLADCHFIQGNHAEAAVAYQQFVRTHPTHEEAHYAAFRRGVSYYEMIPGDWVITPPSHERDQAATRDARDSFSRYLRNYHKSKHRPRAQELLAEVVDALVRHEMYVANFYLRRDDPNAAVVRLTGIRKQFSESSLVPDAMFMHATTLLTMDRIKEARQVFQEITVHFPDHHQSQRAMAYLRHLDKRGRGEKRGDDG